jgi:hypothetical protein
MRQGERTLNDVVSVRVNKSDLNRALPVKARLKEFLNETVTLLDGGVENALLDNVRGELLLSEGEDLTVELGDDGGAVDGFALLDDPLDDVLWAEERRVSRRE